MTTNVPTQRWRLVPSEQRFILVLGDLIAAILALALALYVWSVVDPSSEFTVSFLRHRIPTWFFFLPFLWIILLVDSYDLRKASKFKNSLRSVAVATAVAAIAYLIVYFTVTSTTLPRLAVGFFVAFVAVLTLLARSIYIKMFTMASNQRRVLIVGAGKAGTALAEVVGEIDPKPFNLLGLIDDDPGKLGTSIAGYTIVGNHTSIPGLIKQQGVTDMILAITNRMNHGMFQTILLAQENGINLSTMAETYESLTSRVPINLLESDWVIRSFLDRPPTTGFYKLFKRLVDITVSLIGTFGLVLLYPFIALLITIDSRGPVIHRQERLGLGGNSYTIYKFRTMKDSADMEKEALVTAVNDRRITRIGRFLRKSHLDELPQLINVLRGEMSLVGPRSERNELVIVFQNTIPFYRARMLVKPGITGWAQIHQPYAETVEETAVKLEYDLYYIKHANLVMDIVILLRTFGSVFGFKGR
ncbi:MAG: sugar transferase [Chloroflexi bacterium]|nr:sugar transferase [Chloroflexota bacterium]